MVLHCCESEERENEAGVGTDSLHQNDSEARALAPPDRSMLEPLPCPWALCLGVTCANPTPGPCPVRLRQAGVPERSAQLLREVSSPLTARPVPAHVWDYGKSSPPAARPRSYAV